MKTRSGAPFLRSEETVSAVTRDVILAMVFLLVLPTVYYGFRVLLMAALSVSICALCQAASDVWTGRDASLSGFPVVTGLTVTLLLPPGAPFWMLSAAALFASLAAQAPFGSFAHAPFHPAAAGIAFATVCWPKEAVSFLQPGQNLGLWDASEAVSGAAPSLSLKQGLMPEILPLDMLWGNFPGALGTTAPLILCAGALYLFVRKAADLRITASFLAVCALYAALFPRIACEPLTSVKYELLSGALLFCAIFLLPAPCASPKTGMGRVLYGALAGLLLMLLRSWGAYELEECFAVLLANACSPLIDRAVCAVRFRRYFHEENA